MCQIKNYDVRGLIFGNLGVKKKMFLAWEMLQFIGHLDR